MKEHFTLGVEEEYQLVDPDSGELRSRALVVRRADRTGRVEGEVQDTIVEIGTPVCTSGAEVAGALRERRFQASAAAAGEDLELIAAGIHPFSGWQGQRVADAERPRMLLRLFGQVLRQVHITGMHIHVAIPAEFDRVRLMNDVRAYAPHLLALSCSSPFYLGEDTSFASFRSIGWRAFPFTGAPPHFADAAEYEQYIKVLVRSGVIPDERTVYWSVRPSSRYPTLELRMCDACPSIGDAVAIAVLARALVVAAAEEALEPIGASLSASLQDEVHTENAWLAARDGLGATLIAPAAPDGRRAVRDAIARILERVAPIAESLGDGEALAHVETILTRGNAADRMRERFAGLDEPRAVVDWLIRETRAGTGADRRRAPRDEPGPRP